MSYQFAHLETYSRKSTGKKLSVDQILAEADREDGSCPHVTNPKKPTLIFGLSISDLKNLHEEKCTEATTTNNKGQTRKIRKDQQTMGCIVLSYPSDGEDYNLWEDKSLEWLKEKYGENLKSVIKHTDESHPHLHCYLMSEDMKASGFNEGKKAKDAYMSSSEAKSIDSKEANKIGDRKYRESMRAWQDSYWEKVGIPCGLSRLGPGKRRLPRDAWKKEQAQAQYLKRTIEKGEKWGTDYKARIIAETREQASKIIEQAKAEAQEKLKAHDKELQKLRRELESTKTELQREQEKVSDLASMSIVKRVLNRVRDRAFKSGRKEAIKESKKKISELTEKLESTEEALSRSQSTANRLSSEKQEKVRETNKLKKDIDTLTVDRDRLQSIVNKSDSKLYISNRIHPQA